MSVLIVEDDLPMAEVIAALLRPTVLVKEVVIKATMQAALDLLATHKFDVVLLDLDLPDSLTARTLRTVRKIKELGPKVVVMSGLFAADLTEVAQLWGADASFYKGNADFVAGLKKLLK